MSTTERKSETPVAAPKKPVDVRKLFVDIVVGP